MNIEQFLNEKNTFLNAFLSRERKVAREIADKVAEFSHIYLEKMVGINFIVKHNESKTYYVKYIKGNYVETKGVAKSDVFHFFKRVWLEYVLNKKRDDFFKIWQPLTFEQCGKYFHWFLRNKTPLFSMQKLDEDGYLTKSSEWSIAKVYPLDDFNCSEQELFKQIGLNLTPQQYSLVNYFFYLIATNELKAYLSDQVNLLNRFNYIANEIKEFEGAGFVIIEGSRLEGRKEEAWIDLINLTVNKIVEPFSIKKYRLSERFSQERCLNWLFYLCSINIHSEFNAQEDFFEKIGFGEIDLKDCAFNFSVAKNKDFEELYKFLPMIDFL